MDEEALERLRIAGATGLDLSPGDGNCADAYEYIMTLRADLETADRLLRQSETDLLAVVESFRVDIVKGKPVVVIPRMHHLLAALTRPNVVELLRRVSA